LGTAAVSSIVALWQAYLVFGVLMSIGLGAASSPTAAVAIARWFSRRRGLAVGIVAGGGAAGYFVLLPLMAAALQAAGWRTAFLWLGVGIVLVTVPIVLWLLRDDPRLLPTLVGSPIIAWVSYQVRLGKRPILHP
jgi:MFS family permease